MARLTVAVTLDATPPTVWADVRNIATHTDWMEDAVSIRFTSPSREGVGTTYDCDTRIGPFALTDKMEITSWVEGSEMGVRHVGIVTGTGVFRLKKRRGGRTKFVWTERLEFPWWMGGPVGALAAAPIMKLVWRRNLRNLAARVA